MFRWRAFIVRGRSTRPAISSGVAQPVGLEAVAATVARTWLAARTSSGSTRDSGLVSSAHLLAICDQATWVSSKKGIVRCTTWRSIALDQDSGPGQIVSDLEQSLVCGSGPGPVAR